MNAGALEDGSLFGDIGLVYDDGSTKRMSTVSPADSADKAAKAEKAAEKPKRAAKPAKTTASKTAAKAAPQTAKTSEPAPAAEALPVLELLDEAEAPVTPAVSSPGKEVAEADPEDASDVQSDAHDVDAGGNGAEGGSGGGLIGSVDDVMSGDVEEDGRLTLARYASHAYLEYAMSVVKSRALPDVSDGQKPVQRRILIDMERMGVKAGVKAVKSARVVGDVLGKYHPHGDQSVYDAMVRMAQDFSLRYPLIDGEGNFGSRDGDSQAAMRYTEARLKPIAQLLLDEVDTGAIDFTPNYDGNFQEPVVLPAKLPFVLLNGSSGIAVGMATDIPSHNLGEVARACVLLIDKPEATLDEVLAVLPAPDFPCGGQIISPRSTIRDIYRTGRGRLTVRARYHFEEMARGQWQLVVDELPPASSSQDVLNQIEAITNPKGKKDKKGISAKQQQAKSAMLAILDRVRDESGEGTPVRLVFEPKTSRVDRQAFVAALLSQTSMESNVSVNLVMLGIDGKPRQKGLLEIIREWISFRLEAVRRRTAARLEKVNDRIHVLDGRALVLLNLDRVIEIIRESDDPKAALMAEFPLTERQTDDILEIRLRQLARLAAIAIEKELAELNREKAGLERILGSDAVLRRTVAREVEQAAKQFGDDRRTLIEEAAQVQMEQPVQNDPVTVVLSQKGFLRTRQGHGVDCTLLNYKVGDAFSMSIECSSADDVSFVTDTGRTYTMKVSAIPGGRGDGLPITSFFDLDKATARVVGILAGHDERDMMLVSSDGYGFICKEGDMKSAQRVGRQMMKLNDGQTLLPPLTGLTDLPLCACLSDSGHVIVFPAEEVRRLPNGGMGVTLMKLDEGEKLLDAKLIDSRGFSACGTGRGGKKREVQVTRRKAFDDFLMRRARRGRLLAVSWHAEKLAALPVQAEASPDGAAGAGGKDAAGLVIELEDETPKLL